jgi:hypothetical protein
VKPEEIVARERRFRRPVVLAAFAGVALFIVGIAAGATGGALSREFVDAESLRSFYEDRDQRLLGTILEAVALLLLIAPLFYLFQAAAARSDRVRPALSGITVAGPLFLAGAAICGWIALDQAAADFASPGGGLGVPVGEYVDELVEDQAAYDAAQGLSFAGTLGLVFALVYTSLHAMRVGLLTRFWGSLGMALGVSVIFLGFVAILALFVILGLVIAGWLPGGRPPAWEEGRAVPWPKPGEEPPEKPTTEPANLPQGPTGAPEPVGEGSGPSPRKRKRRRS